MLLGMASPGLQLLLAAMEPPRSDEELEYVIRVDRTAFLWLTAWLSTLHSVGMYVLGAGTAYSFPEVRDGY